jgi:hypothetical protein
VAEHTKDQRRCHWSPDRSGLAPFRLPTGLADGFGPKELALGLRRGHSSQYVGPPLPRCHPRDSAYVVVVRPHRTEWTAAATPGFLTQAACQSSHSLPREGPRPHERRPRFTSLSSGQVANESYSSLVSVAHSPVVPSVMMSPATPSGSAGPPPARFRPGQRCQWQPTDPPPLTPASG